MEKFCFRYSFSYRRIILYLILHLGLILLFAIWFAVIFYGEESFKVFRRGRQMPLSREVAYLIVVAVIIYTALNLIKCLLEFIRKIFDNPKNCLDSKFGTIPQYKNIAIKSFQKCYLYCDLQKFYYDPGNLFSSNLICLHFIHGDVLVSGALFKNKK